MNNLLVNKILTSKELADKFIEINPGAKVVNWNPLIADECRAYANTKQPVIRVDLEDGNWLRVFISKDNGEINWY